MMDDLYQEIILDHYKHPHNKGWFDTYFGASVFRTSGHNGSCGDHFEMAVAIQKDSIIAVKWRGEGCAISTAAVSMASDWIQGKSLFEVKNLKPSDVLKMLGIDVLTPAREKCGFLPLQLVIKLPGEYV